MALILAGCGSNMEPSAGDIGLNDRGVALMGQYEYATAEETFAEVVDRAPFWLDARVNWAIATLNRQREGDERRALEILGDILEQDPDHARAIYVSGILHLYLGNAEPAETLLRRAVDADPDDAFSAYFLGQTLLQSASHADAASWFLRAVELDPYLRSAYWAGAQALRRAGRVEESQALLADYQRFDDNPAAHSAAFSYGRMGPKALALAAAVAAPPAPQRPRRSPIRRARTGRRRSVVIRHRRGYRRGRSTGPRGLRARWQQPVFRDEGRWLHRCYRPSPHGGGLRRESVGRHG